MMRGFHNFARAILVCSLLLVESTFTWADSEILLSSADIEVTENDVFYYLKERIDPRVYQSTLEKPGAISEAVLNIYVIKRAAEQALKEGLISEAELKFNADFGAYRSGLRAFINSRQGQITEAADWNALAKERYIIEQASYAPQELVNVDHILIKSRGRTFTELVAAVDTVQAELDHGESFTTVARAFSEDDSVALNGGSLGFFRRGVMDPAFEEAAFSLSVEGEVSEPVLGGYGVHFIRFNARKMSEAADFDTVREQIVATLKKERLAKIRAESLDNFRMEPLDVLKSIDEAVWVPRILARLQAAE